MWSGWRMVGPERTDWNRQCWDKRVNQGDNNSWIHIYFESIRFSIILISSVDINHITKITRSLSSLSTLRWTTFHLHASTPTDQLIWHPPISNRNRISSANNAKTAATMLLIAHWPHTRQSLNEWSKKVHLKITYLLPSPSCRPILKKEKCTRRKRKVFIIDKVYRVQTVDGHRCMTCHVFQNKKRVCYTKNNKKRAKIEYLEARKHN